MKHYFYFLVSSALLLQGCDKDNDINKPQEAVVIKATGNIAAGIDQFRTLLGGPVNTTPGVVGGRREINWETIPDELIGQPLPLDFFNPQGATAPVGRQRGLRYASTGSFIVSKNNFQDINPEASKQLSAFSGGKSFASVGAAKWEVLPEEPGSSKAATLKGFGIVFSDVDLASSTFMEFYDHDVLLGKFFVPPHDETSSFSFLGVYFAKGGVTKIRVNHLGTLADEGADISGGGTKDFISMDDFLYSEPETP